MKYYYYKAYKSYAVANKRAGELRKERIKVKIVPSTSTYYYGKGKFKKETVYDLYANYRIIDVP